MRAAALLLAYALAAGEEKDETNSIGMNFVRIEAGDFIMGSAEAPPRTRQESDGHDADEAPAHHVRIPRPFLLSVTEVTNAQFERFNPDHAKWRGKNGIPKGDDDPVDFCAWLSKSESRPCRLPTEAESEYACRAGTTTAFHTGETLTPDDANGGLAKDGKTRPHVRMVDRMGGYMSMSQSADGVIYLSTGQGGAGINVAAFNEAWLKEAKE